MAINIKALAFLIAALTIFSGLIIFVSNENFPVNAGARTYSGYNNVQNMSGFVYPCGIAITPNGTYEYVSNAKINTVSVVNLMNGKTIANISGFLSPRDIVISPNGSYAYIANSNSTNISIVNTHNNRVEKNITGLPAGVVGLTLIPASDCAFVFTYYNIGEVYKLNLTSGHTTASYREFFCTYSVATSTNGSYLYVINNAGLTVLNIKTNVTVANLTNVYSGDRMAVTPNGSYALILDPLTGNLSLYSLLTYHMMFNFTGFKQAECVAVNPNGLYAYVTLPNLDKVSRIMIATPYNIKFMETGLPSGTSWSVNLSNGESFKSTNSSIFFIEANGSYQYTLSTVNKDYSPEQFSGVLDVKGSNININVVFKEITYGVTFTESGLPSGTSWSVTLNGTTESSTTDTITFSVPNGTYSYTIATVNRDYAPSPSSGSITVNGANVNQAITFNLVTYTVKFTESGLPSGTSWSIAFNGTTKTSISSSITFNASNGSYSFIVSNVSGYSLSPASGAVNVNGSSVSKAIIFTAAAPSVQKYLVTFKETGLPSGTLWSIGIDFTSNSSSGDAITFMLLDGNYSYTVSNALNYAYSGPISVLVNGSSVIVDITFSNSTHTTSPQTSFSPLILYAIGIIAAIGIVASVIRFRRMRN
jgi:YVTN family beta-propeller protein